jgi:hypothetical protein
VLVVVVLELVVLVLVVQMLMLVVLVVTDLILFCALEIELCASYSDRYHRYYYWHCCYNYAGTMREAQQQEAQAAGNERFCCV